MLPDSELKYEYTVSTRCFTYNHESYIYDAMEGFVMQQTQFPVVYIIVDDASTDNTASVIRCFLQDNFLLHDPAFSYEKSLEYGQLYCCRHRTNNNCVFVALFLKENHYSRRQDKYLYLSEWESKAKYIAICEGDDYWTDPLKLQKQVDFLENNPEYMLCFHLVSVIATNNNIPIDFFSHLKSGDYSAEQIYDKWTIPTCSVLFRSYIYNKVENKEYIVYKDIFLWLQIAENGKLFCLDFIGSVYRRNSEGISVKWDLNRYLNLYRQYKYFEKRFPKLKQIARRDQDNILRALIYAPYFKGIWKYRLLYMQRHPKLFLTPFLTTTILSYTPIRFIRKKHT